ncbi:DoxX family protein [Kribbella antibiotica]|uniref:DoxX family protein n=1 Tax=Kribbella antibiotica TaxID=190195 RepID=A0A4R4Z022_9ACTN|nr:DoxX family protein [Kribbella antibiotica]TDD51076.1 DoxX family protein [Kribbella antibiotica]
MNVFLWILAGVLAALFLGAGATKLTQPRSKLQKNMGWVEDYSDTGVKLIGAVELLGAIGLILPAVLDIAPILVPLAATGFAIIMAAAIVVHARRKELPLAGFNAVLLVLAVVLAIFRFGPNAF